MLRLRDERSGDVVPVRAARRNVLTTYVASGAPGRPELGALRSFLVADLIGRVAARHRLHVQAWHGLPASPQAGDPADFWAMCGALNIYPAEFSARPPDLLDVGIGALRPDPASARDSHWIRVGGVTAAGAAHAPGDALAAAHDPLAIRLALMWSRYPEQASLADDDLAEADAELRRWRSWVADWANFPSRPMSAWYVEAISDALENDLDLPAALRALRALAADDAVPPGSKFETFASLDQVLGLDLARDIGR